MILDNATIHSGAEARIVKDLHWNTIVNGRPLNYLVVPLPAWAPELNPIKLIFHILVQRLCSICYQACTPAEATVPVQVARVLNAISIELVWKCCSHCGY